jgi:two-component system chemotaxis response regulator CheB
MPKVLVVDDSALMRRLLSSVLSEAGYDVQTANNGTDGVEKLVRWQPDVVTLDINMPVMDGLTALSLMMAARPTPVVMISSLTEAGALATFEALALGAVDYIAKPGGTISLSIEDIEAQLLNKVKGALMARPKTAIAAGATSPPQRAASARPDLRSTSKPAPKPAPPPVKSTCKADMRLVLIGVSTGGPRTLEEILPHLPEDFPCAVLVAQHMPPSFTQAFAQRMDRLCAMGVREVTAPVPIDPGHIYIGKGGTDLIVVERLGRLVAMPKPETPGHPWHPSVDVLVDSAMKLLPTAQLTGVMLTGMGNDGAQAMTRLKQHGGRTIAESEATSVVFGMPQELIERGGATVVLPCHDIARQLKSWLP